MKLSVSSYSFQQLISAGKMTQLDTVKAAHDLGMRDMTVMFRLNSKVRTIALRA